MKQIPDNENFTINGCPSCSKSTITWKVGDFIDIQQRTPKLEKDFKDAMNLILCDDCHQSISHLSETERKNQVKDLYNLAVEWSLNRVLYFDKI